MYIGTLPAASNRGAYHQDFQLFDDETDEGIDLTGAVIALDVRKPGRASAELSASTGNGRIVVTDASEGRFALAFTAAEMRALDPITYACGITIAQNGDTIQYFIGAIPVLDGIVG